jgi:hypothetical protein
MNITKIKLWNFTRSRSIRKNKMSNMSNSDRVSFKRSKTTCISNQQNLYEYKRSNLNGFNEAVNQ